MKCTIMLLTLLMPTTVAWGKDKKLVNVKVEVVSDEGMQGTVQGGGAVGAAVGRRVVTDAWTMKVIVNGEHAMLKCYENHHACHFFGVGTYDGELKMHSKSDKDWGFGENGKPEDPDLWVHYIRPIDHVDIREHWKVSGSW